MVLSVEMIRGQGRGGVGWDGRWSIEKLASRGVATTGMSQLVYSDQLWFWMHV